MSQIAHMGFSRFEFGITIHIFAEKERKVGL